MHLCSDKIGAIAAALAKAQAELSNPEKTLTGTIQGKHGERVFRYASLASGLDIVRKFLGPHEIAMMQTTAVEQGQITLTTLLVHASGEWVSSLWPVCPAGESSAQVKGAALTYARRYALFTLVGIAGEDDLDAPELPFEAPPQPGVARSKLETGNTGTLHSPRPALLDAKKSAELRDRLLREITSFETDDALAVWAYRSFALKNTLTKNDAEAVEAAYLAKVQHESPVGTTAAEPAPSSAPEKNGNSPPLAACRAKSVRRRSKAHLSFVASQPCLICRTRPCDAHHLKIAQPRSLGRKVSDEYTVPLCREHHRDLHQLGNEANWWTKQGIEPLAVAAGLWAMTHELPDREAKIIWNAAPSSRIGEEFQGRHSGSAADLAGKNQNSETKPIARSEDA